MSKPASKKSQRVVEQAADEETDESENSISKSQRKRDSHALQDVGEELVRFAPETLKKMDLPEDLLVALLDAKRIPPSKFGGRKRQMQYIGRLMRDIDAAPIIARLEALKAPSKHDTALHHLAERWRERMLQDASAVAAFTNEFVEADREFLARTADAAKSDQAKGRPPKHFRLLYQHIHDVLVKAAAPEETSA